MQEISTSIAFCRICKHSLCARGGDLFQRLQSWGSHGDAVMAFGVIGIILMIIIPLPPFLLDALLSFSIVFSVITLLLTLYVEKALDFNAFPSLLLFLTLYRLALNVASTRMILAKAQAGDIIHTFGDFVTQSSTAVGIILFSLITIINFIVITKGAGRIAEVAARFTLEALSGKQMAIESELNAGILTHPEAKKEREKIVEEADFYGAMDGASKFVRGDAIASVLITFVNIIGGMAIGVAVKGYSWQDAWNTFVRLTIGDGLVSQIPALLVSLGAGIMVTRASVGSVGKLVTRQIFHQPKVLLIAAAIVFFLSLVPGMPFLIMLPIGFGLCVYAVLKLRKKEKKSPQEKKSFFHSPLEIQLGVNAVRIAEQIIELLPEIRRKISAKLGIIIPQASISDNPDLPPHGWKIFIKGVAVSHGRETELPSLTASLSNVLEKYAYELICRQDVLQIIEEVKKFDPALIEELIPKKLVTGHVLKILKNLLKEKIPINDMATIFEVLADHIDDKKPDLEMLTEKVRQRLARGISQSFFGKSKLAHVIAMDPHVENIVEVSNGKLRPRAIEQLLQEVQRHFTAARLQGIEPVVVTSAGVRAKLKKMLEEHFPELPVLSYSEIAHDVEINKIGYLGNEILINLKE